MVKGDTQERKENLKNAGEALKEFEGRMNAEIRKQEKIDMVEERDFRRGDYWGSLQQRCCMGGMMGNLRRNT